MKFRHTSARRAEEILRLLLLAGAEVIAVFDGFHSQQLGIFCNSREQQTVQGRRRIAFVVFDCLMSL